MNKEALEVYLAKGFNKYLEDKGIRKEELNQSVDKLKRMRELYLAGFFDGVFLLNKKIKSQWIWGMF